MSRNPDDILETLWQDFLIANVRPETPWQEIQTIRNIFLAGAVASLKHHFEYVQAYINKLQEEVAEINAENKRGNNPSQLPKV